VATILGELDLSGCQARGVHNVCPRLGINDELVELPFGVLDVHPGVQAGDGDTARVADDLDRVVAGGAVDDHGVGRAVADVPAHRRRQIDVDLSDIGAGQVADVDGVGAAQGGEVDLLDAVEVHGDGADVAGEEHPAAVGGDVDLLGDVGADELQ